MAKDFSGSLEFLLPLRQLEEAVVESIAAELNGTANATNTTTTTTTPLVAQPLVEKIYFIVWSLAFAVAFIAAFCVLLAFRHHIGNFCYSNTVGVWKCPSFRNTACGAWCCATCCPRLFPSYHPPFRLRIVIHEGLDMRNVEFIQGMRCFVTAVCGYNKPKSTSVQPQAWFTESSPVRWNEALDFIVHRADDSVILQVMEKNSLHKDVVVGTLVLRTDDLWELLRKDGDKSFWIGTNELRDKQDIRRTLLYENKQAGTLVFSVYATHESRALPPYQPGMGTGFKNEESRPLLGGLFGSSGGDK